MVNSTNYAAMSYDELVTINLAFHLAISEVKPLISIRRAEEMAARTHEYAVQMNKYCASKEEVLAYLENEALNETPFFSTATQEVDDQAQDAVPNAESWNEQARKEAGVLLLPEHFESMVDEDQGQVMTGSADVGKRPTEEPDSSETVSMETNETFVEEAMGIMRTLTIPDNVDPNEPYYMECDFSYDGELGHSVPSGRNMRKKDLEEFRSASEAYFRIFKKKSVIASTDDFLVYNDSLNTFTVRLYHFPKDMGSAIDAPAKEATLSSDEIKKLKKKHSYLRKAIKLATEYSYSDGTDVHEPFYDRYLFSAKSGNKVGLKSDRVRVYENVANLTELIPAFESYAKLFQEGYTVLAKDNCVAAMLYETIYVVLFNIPTQEKKRKVSKKSAPVAKDTCATKVTEVVTETSPTEGVSDLILKAVEMTKALPAVNGTDGNLPYYLQSNFSVANDGNLIYSGKPFSQNVSLDEFDKYKKNHGKYAKTLKASNTVSTNEYTAFIWNDGKNLMVFDYNANPTKR